MAVGEPKGANRYDKGHNLGEGTYGVVFKAVDIVVIISCFPYITHVWSVMYPSSKFIKTAVGICQYTSLLAIREGLSSKSDSGNLSYAWTRQFCSLIVLASN